jgi:hypothetical protein
VRKIQNVGTFVYMIVWITTACPISAYNHESCDFEPSSCRGVLDTTLCDKVCQWVTCVSSVVFSGFPSPIKLTATI